MFFLCNKVVDFTQSSRYQAGFHLFYSLAEEYNNGINFFLHILSGTKFRNDLKQLFGFCKGRQEASCERSAKTSSADSSSKDTETNIF